MTQTAAGTGARGSNRLARYYAVRAAFSLLWVAAAFAVGTSPSPVASALLLLYPAWDGLANYRDAQCNGGLGRNPSQAFNVLVSAIVTVGIALSLVFNAHGVLYVFGAWAFLAGLLQLATGVRRWRRVGAQWPMILSGAQSALAGVVMTKAALVGTVAGPRSVALYAAFGAFYFLVSALWLAVTDARRSKATHVEA